MGIAQRCGALALAGLVVALMAGCATETPAPVVTAPAISPDALVGKWGLAAYHKDADRTRTIKEAIAQCNKPYVIKQGPSGGLMMYLADNAQIQELVLKARAGWRDFLGPPGDAGTTDDRQVLERRPQFVHNDLG